MPRGKPAGARCIQLEDDQRCRLFGLPERPEVCRSLRPQPEMCRGNRAEAMLWIAGLERQTNPA